MNFPDHVRAAVEEAVRAHPDDATAAIDDAEARVRALPDFRRLVDAMVRNSVQELVYDARHAINVRAKRQNGGYGPPAKVEPASAGVMRAHESVYNYFIAGRTLGDLQGNELGAVAAGERARADGHRFNAVLCERLERLVPAERRVRDAVPERRLRALFASVGEEVRGDRAA